MSLNYKQIRRSKENIVVDGIIILSFIAASFMLMPITYLFCLMIKTIGEL